MIICVSILLGIDVKINEEFIYIIRKSSDSIITYSSLEKNYTSK